MNRQGAVALECQEVEEESSSIYELLFKMPSIPSTISPSVVRSTLCCCCCCFIYGLFVVCLYILVYLLFVVPFVVYLVLFT